MLLSLSIISICSVLTLARANINNQEPLISSTAKSSGIIKSLKKSSIIPTVIDKFNPTHSLSVTWDDRTNASLGNTLPPSSLQSAPSIQLSSLSSLYLGSKDTTLVLTLTDPDAPSRDDPKWSEMCHWIAVSGPETNIDDNKAINLHDLIPYKAPGPPPKTGPHRYVFLVLTPSNGTDEPLHLSKPEDRQHWGYGEPDHGVRDWAEENGLVPIAANFVYSKNKKQ